MPNPFLDAFHRRQELMKQEEMQKLQLQQQRDLAEQELMLRQHGMAEQAAQWRAAQAQQQSQFEAQQEQRRAEQADMWRKVGVQLEAEGAARQARPTNVLSAPGLFPMPLPSANAQDFGGRMLEIIPKRERVTEEQEMALEFERTKRREAANFINSYISDPSISKMFTPQQLAEFKIASVLGVPISSESTDRLQASLIRDYMQGDAEKKKNALTGLKLLWTGYESRRQPLPSPSFINDQQVNQLTGTILSELSRQLKRDPTQEEWERFIATYPMDDSMRSEVWRRGRLAVGQTPFVDPFKQKMMEYLTPPKK